MHKVIQLFETKNSRHSAVLVGKTGAAKSTTWKVLKGALTRLNLSGKPHYNKVEVSQMMLLLDTLQIYCFIDN